jgi:hypothetical protein
MTESVEVVEGAFGAQITKRSDGNGRVVFTAKVEKKPVQWKGGPTR